MADAATNRQSFPVQAGYCAAMDAPVTARVATLLGDVLDDSTAVGARVLGWPGEPVADALVLRLIGGLHALHRAGVDAGLSAVFDGSVTDPTDVAATLARVLRDHDTALLPWLDGPPQTNEPARSAALMAGMLHLAARYGPRVEVLEIGSSAGLNLLLDRYRYDLGGVAVGPVDGPVTIRPDWSGTPPPAVPIAFTGVRGVDLNPVDVADTASADRLQAYVWVDAVARIARLSDAIAMMRASGRQVEFGDAADWIEARLAEPQPAGTMRVLMHSVVWQYLTDATQSRIRDAMAIAGARATPDRPLGWVMMEPNRDLHRQEVRVQGWPGNTPMQLVALAHAHGAWVEGLSPPFATTEYAMRAYSDR